MSCPTRERLERSGMWRVRKHDYRNCFTIEAILLSSQTVPDALERFIWAKSLPVLLLNLSHRAIWLLVLSSSQKSVFLITLISFNKKILSSQEIEMIGAGKEFPCCMIKHKTHLKILRNNSLFGWEVLSFFRLIGKLIISMAKFIIHRIVLFRENCLFQRKFWSRDHLQFWWKYLWVKQDPYKKDRRRGSPNTVPSFASDTLQKLLTFIFNLLPIYATISPNKIHFNKFPKGGFFADLTSFSKVALLRFQENYKWLNYSKLRNKLDL